MIGRAVTAFRKSVTKSHSANTLSDANDESESIVSDDLQETNAETHRRVSETSGASSHLLWLRKRRRSQSANREGDEKYRFNPYAKENQEILPKYSCKLPHVLANDGICSFESAYCELFIT